MQTKNKILIFTAASASIHAVVFILFGMLVTNEPQLVVSSFNNYQPLQVALHLPTENTLPHSDQDSRKTAALPVKQTAVEKTSVVTLNIETPEPVMDAAHNKPDNSTEGAALQESNVPDESIIAESRTENTEPEAQRTPSTDTTSAKARNSMIREKLNTLIRENFSYPGFAVKRGWQGTVKLGLRIEANGTLSNVHIVKTSGYSILDQAALTTLSKAEHINGIESWLAGNYFDTTLPVVYRLIDG